VSGVRSTDANATASHHTGSALLTVYDLDEDAAARLEASEGATFEVTDVSARLEKKEGGLELVASRRSRWRRVAPSALARAHLAPKPTPRRLATVRDLSSETSFGPNAPRNDGKVRFGEEFDCVAAIVRVARPTPQSAPTSQWVFLADASVGEALDSGFAPDLSSMSCDAELLAVETHVTHAEAFVDAEAWGAGAGFEKAQNSATTKNSFETIPVALENLMYTRRDAANGVRVAAFTERSRATPLRVLGGTPNAKRRGPFGAGPNAPLAARAARALRRRFGSGRDENENENETENGGDARTTAELRNALLARVRALTGSADESPSEMDIARPGDESARPGVPARRASLRRKRSLSLGSDAEWGASQLDVIEAVEAKALEARRRRGAETQ
jgi:breast cancer 2 susceptibility protein